MKSFLRCFLLLIGITLFRPFESSAQWLQTNGPYGGDILSMASSGQTLYAGTARGGVFRSTDNGATWTPIGLSDYMRVTSIAVNGSDVYAVVINDYYAGQMFRWSGAGTAWTQVSGDLPTGTLFSLVKVLGSTMFVATSPGISRSTDNGAHWTKADAGLPTGWLEIYDFAECGSYVFAATQDGIFRSGDGGLSWSASNNGLSTSTGVKGLAVIGTAIFAFNGNGKVYRSTDGGANWIELSIGTQPKSVFIVSLAVVDGELFAGGYDQIYRSTDNGANWIPANGGLTCPEVSLLESTGTGLFAGTCGNGIFRTADKGATWTSASGGMINTFITALWANGSAAVAGNWPGSVFRTGNGGADWSYVGLSAGRINALAQCGTDLFLASDSGLYRSTNQGASWTAADTIFNHCDVTSLAVSDTVMIAGSVGSVFISNDRGTTWTKSNAGLTVPDVRAVALMKGKLFAGTGSGVFLSENGGAEWKQITSSWGINSLAVRDTDLFAATDGGVYHIVQSATSWKSTDLAGSGIHALAVAGTRLFAGGRSEVICCRLERPRWGWVSIGLSEEVTSLAASDTYLYAGTSGGGVYKQLLSSILSVHPEHSGSLPAAFSLGQNYPNPFNPSTTFSFSLPSRAFVTVSVFDVMGREVARVVDEELAAGAYTARWNASGMPSGVYYYRMLAGSYAETRRMLLVK